MTVGLTYDGALSRVEIALSGFPNGTVQVQRSINAAATDELWAEGVVRGARALPIEAGAGSAADAEFFADVENFYRVVQTSTEDNMSVFTASGTWNKPPGLVAARITVVGPGGAGGGADDANAGQSSAGNGGSSGVTAVSVIDAASLGSSETVTVGTGGVGGTGTGGSGSGPSSFGIHVSANAGDGGTRFPASGTDAFGPGTAGSSVGTGQVVIPGSPGGPAMQLPTFSIERGGDGGSGPFGSGGRGGRDENGFAGLGFGAGGGGASAAETAGSTRNGGDGADGLVIVEHFFDQVTL